MSSTGTPSCWRWMMSVLAKTAQRPEMRETSCPSARPTSAEKSSILSPRRVIWSSKNEPVPEAQLSFMANSGTAAASRQTK